jgi:hypothetical protein
MRRLAKRREHKLTIDSSATSNFVCKELDLLKDRVSNKEVFLPNNSKLKTSHKTKLPFEQLSDAEREVHILPGLKQSLLSVNKMSGEGYATIFHPGEEGVGIHKKGTITITTSKPPVLQGCKSNQEKLWMVSANQKMTKSVMRQTVYTACTIYSTDNIIPPCSRRIPSKRNMDRCSQSRKLYNVTKSYNIGSSKTLYRLQ